VKAEAQQPANSRRPRWVEAWPDALAFALGLGLAWWEGWHTTDLVWSLWLSSFCVGYAIIVVTIFRPVFQMIAASNQALTASTQRPAAGAVIVDTLVAGGGLFMLAFFTVHFGLFHYVHSMLLNAFFPIGKMRGFSALAIYAEVFRRYWPFVIITAVAERAVFRAPPPAPPDTAVTPEAIARRKAQLGGSGMMVAYKGVLRMHLLIFFFAFAHFVHLENFVVYAVVYFVYFFPWWLLRREELKS
jgi:hypothetical protein